MKLSEEVRPGANRYVSGQEILQDLEAYLAPFKELAVITGEKSFQVFQDFYPKTLSYPIFIMTAQHLLKTGKS
ncbi:Glycerol dehydrogenase [Lactococcus cremoris subsp. cremoris A76]|nr:Glycerol dehydrogenase [Lactococcus cremoris subsp. cremoris A76]